MRRCVLSYVAGYVRRFASVPIGGLGQTVRVNAADDGGRRRPKPKAYRQKAPKKHVAPFRESVDTSGEIERRCIRTRPRRRDDSKYMKELHKCVDLKTSPVTLGRHVEPPKFNPQRPDLEDGDIDLECLPDTFEFYNPFTSEVDKIDFSVFRSDKENNSREAKALRWTEENVPLRDDDLPIALRNPEIREKTLKEALGPGSRPKDIWKIFSMKEPTVYDIDPWIAEEYQKLPVDRHGKRMNVIQLICHPRTLRAAVNYLKIMNPTYVEGHISDQYLEELSELVLKGKFEPPHLVPDPPNPYRMEDHEDVNIVLPKEDPDSIVD